MTESSPAVPHPPRAPLHFWAVGVLLVLWNCWGLAGAVAAQVRLRPGMPADASDYFESQPLWFVVFADLSPLDAAARSADLTATAACRWDRWADRS